MKKNLLLSLSVLFLTSSLLSAQNAICDSLFVDEAYVENNSLYITVYNSSTLFMAYPYFTIDLIENSFITANEDLSIPTFLSVPTDAGAGFTTGFYQLSLSPESEVPANTLFQGSLHITDPNDETFSCSYIFEFTYGSLVTHVNEETKSSFHCYPNPTDDVFFYQSLCESEMVELSIYDFTGRLIRRQNIAPRGMIDVSDFTTGHYLLSIATSEEIYYQKVMIN
jgi:hypothetical protein